MKAKSIKGKTAEHIKIALEKTMTEGFRPTVAIVFIANDDEQQNIVKLLSEKAIQIFGASTGDNFTDGQIETGSIIILLLEINPGYFQITIRDADQGNIKKSCRANRCRCIEKV